MTNTKTITLDIQGQEREVEVEITYPDISIMNRFDPTRQGLQTNIINIDPPCCVTDEMEEWVYETIKGDLVNH